MVRNGKNVLWVISQDTQVCRRLPSDHRAVSMPIDLARVKGLCFDVDGTLSDTDDHWVSRITRLLGPLRFLFKKGNPQPFARWLVMVTESPR